LQVAAAQEMYVQVKDRLAGTGTDVDYGSIAIFDAALARYFGGGELAIADKFRIFGCRFLESVEMFLGNDEHMGRSLGIDIFEGESVLVFVDFLGRNFSADDAAEQAIIHDTSQL
jgi:hypothetical protein